MLQKESVLSKNVCKVRLGLLENKRSKTEGCHNKNPKICGRIKMLKEPCITVNGIAVALNNVGHGIELNKPFVLIGYDLNIPENRCAPLE